jgi:hypothetical protein
MHAPGGRTPAETRSKEYSLLGRGQRLPLGGSRACQATRMKGMIGPLVRHTQVLGRHSIHGAQLCSGLERADLAVMKGHTAVN